MEDRGRKGTFDVIKPVATLPGQRLAPPASLCADEIETWRSIVASMPADWFNTCPFMLRALVAHIANAEVLSVAVAAMRGAKDRGKRLQEFNRLTAMLHRENQMIVNLSQKLRLAPRAKYTMERSTNLKSQHPNTPRPWDIRHGDTPDAS
jgi:hypothetical protein